MFNAERREEINLQSKVRVATLKKAGKIHDGTIWKFIARVERAGWEMVWLLSGGERLRTLATNCARAREPPCSVHVVRTEKRAVNGFEDFFPIRKLKMKREDGLGKFDELERYFLTMKLNVDDFGDKNFIWKPNCPQLRILFQLEFSDDSKRVTSKKKVKAQISRQLPIIGEN